MDRFNKAKCFFSTIQFITFRPTMDFVNTIKEAPIRTLEEAIILTCADYGVPAGRYPGFTGVWIEPDKPTARKICAMGVRASRWVTMHGFAFNVNTDLDYFSNIIPCGIDDKDVTSLKRELGQEVDMDEVKEKLRGHIARLFEMEVI